MTLYTVSGTENPDETNSAILYFQVIHFHLLSGHLH